MKKYLLLLIVFFSIVSYSQEKSSIVFHKKNSEKIKEIKENRRIKFLTLDGKKHYGRFTIIDSVSIKIDGHIIALDSISKIKRKSLAATIANPVAIALGAVAIIAGFVELAQPGSNMEGAAGAMALTVGGAMELVVIISSSYKRKDWEYAIKYNNKIYNSPGPIIIEETGTKL